MGRSSLVALVVLALGSVACSGSGSSPSAVLPTSPSAVTPPVSGPASSGATVTGSVALPSGSRTASGASTSATGMSVGVVGTTLSSRVDERGEFSLAGVPAGDQRLHFSGNGNDATTALNGVRAGEAIRIQVVVTGTTAVIEADSRQPGTQVEIEGLVESLPPTAAAGTLVVAGRTIRVDASTTIREGATARTFDDLRVGYRVHVRARSVEGALLAESIVIQNTRTDAPVNLNGVISDLSGAASAFRFVVNGREVRGDAATQLTGNTTRTVDFGNLENGLRVEVKGVQRDGYVYAERIHVTFEATAPAPTPDPDQQDSASIHGTLTSISGSAPNLVLVVGGTTVRTSGATEVRRRGDVQPLSALALGQSLHVVGTRRSDTSLDARMIRIEEDAVGGAFEIAGPAGGVKGTCPSLSFVVMGYEIATNGATTFVGGTCSSLRSGHGVHVKGTRRADGSVLATEVKR